VDSAQQSFEVADPVVKQIADTGGSAAQELEGCNDEIARRRSYVGLAAFIVLTWDFTVWRGWLVST
jgi:hypothetical protein